MLYLSEASIQYAVSVFLAREGYKVVIVTPDFDSVKRIFDEVIRAIPRDAKYRAYNNKTIFFNNSNVFAEQRI